MHRVNVHDESFLLPVPFDLHFDALSTPFFQILEFLLLVVQEIL